MTNKYEQFQGLYNSSLEHDACGVGFIANIKGHKSHQIVSDALTILENMEHRGACGCDPDSGDGAGILVQIPHDFLKQESLKIDISLENEGSYGVGMLFFPKKATIKEACRRAISKSAEKLGLSILGYRKVPVNTGIIGESAFSSEPDIEQVFIAKPNNIHSSADFERKLYVLKNYITKTVRESVALAEQQFYIVSMSQNIIIYKGEFTSSQVRIYFPDLNEMAFTSAFGMIHSRFSTNTFPSWRLAQPFRFIAHNGEINTLKGNLNWFYSGIRSFVTPFFSKDEMDMLLPVIDNNQSDSACLDNVIELLFHCGRSLPHVMMMLIPEAWDGNEQMDPITKAFYEYHATLIEPWDGPAAIAFTDGHLIGATLDRNGLRPQRFVITSDDQIIVASEAGVLPVDESKVI